MEIEPPHDLEIENSLIGGLFVDAEAIYRVSDILKGSDFYDDLLGQVYDAFVLMAETNEHRDLGLVLSRLKKYGITADGMNAARIAKLANQAVTGHASRHYAREIVSYSNHRRAIEMLQKAAGKLLRKGVNPRKVLSWVSNTIEGIESRESIDLATIGTAAESAVSSLRERIGENGRGSHGASTSIPSLDRTIGGLCNGDLVVLAARPAQGKTALAMQMLNAAAYAQQNALFVSLEMTAEELASRVMCAMAGVDGRRVRSGEVTEYDVEQLARAAHALKDRSLKLYAPSKATPRHIRAAAKLAGMNTRVDLLCVDYLNIVEPESRSMPRVEQVASITGAMKGLAKELKIPVLLLCQLNRDAEGQVPKLSHLKEAGAIEQDADVVLTIHHEDKRTKVGKSIAIISVLKNRHGPTGDIRCEWSPAATKFSEAYDDGLIDMD